MAELNRYTVRVPYSEVVHGEVEVEVTCQSPEQARVEAMAQVRPTLRHPVIHDPEVIATVPLEVVGD